MGRAMLTMLHGRLLASCLKVESSSFRWAKRLPSSGRLVVRQASGHFLRVNAQVGLIYGSSTGNTRSVAYLIKKTLGDQVSEPQEVSTLSVDDLEACSDGLIIGAPTWATACDTLRTGTAMDDLLWQVGHHHARRFRLYFRLPLYCLFFGLWEFGVSDRRKNQLGRIRHPSEQNRLLHCRSVWNLDQKLCRGESLQFLDAATLSSGPITLSMQ